MAKSIAKPATKSETKSFDDHVKEDFQKFLDEFKSESDRAAVILGAAKLDILLYQLLIKVLISSPSGNDELFDGDSPLGTFSAKINLAFRLGLIDNDFTRALHLIRKIRNSFAHEISGTTLDTGGHRDRVRSLCLPLKDYVNYESLRANLLDNKKDVSTDFRLALCVALMRLQVAINHAEQIKPLGRNGCNFIPPLWKKQKDDPQEVEQNPVEE